MIYEYFTKELELRETRYFPRSHSQPCGRVSLKRRYLCQSSVLVPILLSQFSSVAQSCPTLSDPMDCSPPGSSIHGILQAKVLEWGAIAFSTCIGRRSLNYWTAREVPLQSFYTGCQGGSPTLPFLPCEDTEDSHL